MNIFVCNFEFYDKDKIKFKTFVKREQCFEFLSQALNRKIRELSEPNQIIKHKVIIKLIELNELDLVYEAISVLLNYKFDIVETRLEGHVLSE